MKQSTSNNLQEPNAEDAEIVKSLLNYPALEKVFSGSDSANLSAMRQKMQLTIDDLERVIRRGSKEDAEKAAATVKAFQTVLSFLNELENLRQSKSK